MEASYSKFEYGVFRSGSSRVKCRVRPPGTPNPTRHPTNPHPPGGYGDAACIKQGYRLSYVVLGIVLRTVFETIITLMLFHDDPVTVILNFIVLLYLRLLYLLNEVNNTRIILKTIRHQCH